MNQLVAIQLLNSELGPIVEIPCQGQIGFAFDPGISASYLPPLLSLFYTGEWPEARPAHAWESCFFPFENSWVLFQAEGAAGPFVLAVFAAGGQLKRQLLPGDWSPKDWTQQQQALSPDLWYQQIQQKKIKLPPLLRDGIQQQEVFRGQLATRERKAFQTFRFFAREQALIQADIFSPVSSPGFPQVVKQSLVALQAGKQPSLDLKALRSLLASFSRKKQAIECFQQVQAQFEQVVQLHHHQVISTTELRQLHQEVMTTQEAQLKSLQSLKQEISAGQRQQQSLQAELANLPPAETRNPDLSEAILTHHQALHQVELALAKIPAELPVQEVAPYQARKQRAISQEQEAILALRLLDAQQQQLHVQEKQARKALEAAINREEAQKSSLIADLEAQMNRLQSRQEALRGTFLSWLEDRYPGWEQHIGKIVREEILLHPYLAPQIVRLNDLLYGVQLDLSEVEVSLPSEHRYQIQIEELQRSLDREQQSLVGFREESEQKRVRLEKRFQQKQRQLRKEITQAQHQVEQSQLLLKKWQAEESSHVSHWRIRQEQLRLDLQAQLATLQDRALENPNGPELERAQLQQALAQLNHQLHSLREQLHQAEEQQARWQETQQQLKLSDLRESAPEESPLPISFPELLDRLQAKGAEVHLASHKTQQAWQAYLSHFPAGSLWGWPEKWETLSWGDRLEQIGFAYEESQLAIWQQRLLDEQQDLWVQIRDLCKPYLQVPAQLVASGQAVQAKLDSLQQGAAVQLKLLISPAPLTQILESVLAHAAGQGDSSGPSLFQAGEPRDPLAGFPLLSQLSTAIMGRKDDFLTPETSIELSTQLETSWGTSSSTPPAFAQQGAWELLRLALFLQWQSELETAEHPGSLTGFLTTTGTASVLKICQESKLNVLYAQSGPLPVLDFSRRYEWEVQEQGIALLPRES
jgi:hypothetical protein